MDKRANEAWRKHLQVSDKKQSDTCKLFPHTSKSSHLIHIPTMPMTVAAPLPGLGDVKQENETLGDFLWAG